jgi:hypothetical protein
LRSGTKPNVSDIRNTAACFGKKKKKKIKGKQAVFGRRQGKCLLITHRQHFFFFLISFTTQGGF